MKKIAIFDFDGTLVDTPLPDPGKQDYERITGEKWPYQGWWGRRESLNMDVFDMPVLDDVIAEYNKAKAEPDTVVVMLTGRMIKLSTEVKKILDAKGLSFDEYHYNKGGRTDAAKVGTMAELLKKYPDVRVMEAFDDRQEHFPTFQQWGDEMMKADGSLDVYKLNLVPSSNHH